MIEQLLPGLCCAETFGDPPAADLFPEEEVIIARSVEKRRREFNSGRQRARAALAALGYPPQPLLSGTRGQPLWPAGVIGAITHCDGYCAAVVGDRDQFWAVGIDAEPHLPLPSGVLEAIARPEELARIDRLCTVQPQLHWDRALFSAKESVYKAWYPQTHRPLGFEDVSVKIDPYGGTFTGRLLVPGLRLGAITVESIQGRWLVERGFVVTAIAYAATTVADQVA